jgi:hypothetical protein
MPGEDDVAFVAACWGERLDREADKFFPPRRRSNHDHVYFEIAYGDDMKQAGAGELRTKLGLVRDVPAVGIFPPVFDDAPHGYADLVYADSGLWLEKTLEICATVTGVAWLVRNHPWSMRIGDTAEFERIVAPFVAKYPHIKVCPSDVATDSLFSLLHAGVSIASTASLELAAAGVPGIVAGGSYFTDCGFLRRPRDPVAYEAALRSITELRRLTPDEIAAAKRLAYVYFNSCQHDTSLTPPVMDVTSPDFGFAVIPHYWETAIAALEKYRFEEDPAWCNFQRLHELGRSLMLRFDAIEG